MNVTFTRIIRKVFETKIFTVVIPNAVDKVLHNNGTYDIKGKCTLSELDTLFSQIHQNVMIQLFKPYPKQQQQS